MGVTFDYRTKQAYDVPGIIRVRDVARSAFADFRDFEPGDLEFGTFKARRNLPSLDLPEGVRVPRLYVSAVIPEQAWSLALARELLERYGRQWSIGSFDVDCAYVPRDGIANSRSPHNSVGIRVKNEAKYFCYSAAAGQRREDVEYRRELFARLIEGSRLPITIRDGAHGYLMQHATGGDLWLSGSHRGGSHDTFHCELPGLSVSQLVGLLGRFLQDFVRDGPRRYGWSCNVFDDPLRPNLGKEIYDWLGKEGFPIHTATVNLGLQLTDLQALDGLSRLCDKRGEFLTQVCLFQASEDAWARLDVVTRRDGHYLVLILPDPAVLPQVQAVLNLPLRKRPRVG